MLNIFKEKINTKSQKNSLLLSSKKQKQKQEKKTLKHFPSPVRE